MRSRSALLACALVVACYQKPDIVPGSGCADAACTTSDAAPSSSDGSSTAEPDPTLVTTAPPTTDDPSDPDDGTSSSSEGTSSNGDESSSDDESSSTGAPVDNTYGPCSSDAECTTGVCYSGFCSIVCWTQVGGEVECPAAPGDATGLVISCGRLSAPSCEGCFDCGQYCIPECGVGDVCPSGGACLADTCGQFEGVCG